MCKHMMQCDCPIKCQNNINATELMSRLEHVSVSELQVWSSLRDAGGCDLWQIDVDVS